MLVEVLILAAIGVMLGTIAGIIPGIHPNLLATLSIALYQSFNMPLDPLSMSIMVFTMALTNTFIAFIPSTFLGVPDAGTAMSMLPSHQYTLQGKAHEAVILTLIGSVAAVVGTIIIIPLFILFIRAAGNFLKAHTPFILMLAAAILIFRERSRFFAMYSFLASGILGVYALNLPTLKNPLLPLLSGLFGMPSLVLSIVSREKTRPQQFSFPSMPLRKGIKAVSTSIVTGTICSFLPSLGPSQAAVLSSSIIKEKSREAYLIVVGSLNTINIVISIVTFYLVQRARNGAVVAIASILPSLTKTDVFMFIAVALVSCFPISWLTIVLSRKFCLLISKVKYQNMSIMIVLIMAALTLILSGWVGMVVLMTAAAIGFIPVLKGINRNHLMGCLMLSTILWYLV